MLGVLGIMEVDEQNKRGEEIGQDVETLEREEEVNARRDGQTHDNMWMNMFL